MMNTAIINELSEIVHSKADDKEKLLKIEVLVGLAEKFMAHEVKQPAQPAPQVVPKNGPIVSVESLN